MTPGVARSGLIPILTVLVRQEVDVVSARQRARQIASVVGFPNQDQVRIATAVSELTRHAHRRGGGRVEFAIAAAAHPQALEIAVTWGGAAGDSPVDAGIIGSRRLMDSSEVESDGRTSLVRLSKFLPAEVNRFDTYAAAALASRLTEDRLPAVREAEIQNHDLLETLETLRLREIELSNRQAELQRLAAELEQTNLGVVALYAELEEKAAALRSADELKDHFLRHVSHEFRTPLNSILALTQLLLRRIDGNLSEEQERQVGYIRKAAQDLTEIVNDLLDLARVNAGKTEIHIGRIHLARFFSALRGMMRPLVTSGAVSLVFEEPPEDFFFDSDESKIAQILRNLVSNALKFTERGEVRVSSEISDDFLAISVADTGIGIAVEDQDRIFQEFAQVHSSIQRRVKGSGLGLPLSRKLAGLLGGRLSVCSEPGRGATFTLALPIGIRDTIVPSRFPAESDCILIIDDDETDRYIARQRLRGTRYRIIEASGGSEGAERARFERPALILLDLAMADRHGFDVLDDLKMDPATSDIPVLIHTSRILSEADLNRLANRHSGLFPKGGACSPEAAEFVRKLLGEPHLLASEISAGEKESQST